MLTFKQIKETALSLVPYWLRAGVLKAIIEVICNALIDVQNIIKDAWNGVKGMYNFMIHTAVKGSFEKYLNDYFGLEKQIHIIDNMDIIEQCFVYSNDEFATVLTPYIYGKAEEDKTFVFSQFDNQLTTTGYDFTVEYPSSLTTQQFEQLMDLVTKMHIAGTRYDLKANVNLTSYNL